MVDSGLAWNTLLQVRDELKAFFKERSELVDCGLVALLCNAHLFILGPPGTAKSLLAETLAGGIDGARYFGITLNKFLTWRDLACGQVVVHEDVSGNTRSVRFRNVEGPMLHAHIIFFDELFKAGGATLLGMLPLLNERTYCINAGEVKAAPLMCAFAASNEMPAAEDSHLRAFADRLLLWYEVDYISVSHGENTAFIDMLTGGSAVQTPKLTFEDLKYLQRQAREVSVDHSIFGLINSIRATLKLDFRIEPSDRRFKASIPALKAYAFLNGHARVQTGDLAVLEHILWAGRAADAREQVRRVVREYAVCVDLSAAESMFRQATETFRDALARLDEADRAIPFDEVQRKRRDDLRNKSWDSEQELSKIYRHLEQIVGSMQTPRACALGRTYLNEVEVMRKALIRRRGVEDPFAGVGHARAGG